LQDIELLFTSEHRVQILQPQSGDCAMASEQTSPTTPKNCRKAKSHRKAKDRAERKSGKGDPGLLGGKSAVPLRTAEQYLDISDRHRQNLMKSGILEVIGQGHNRKITTESLLRYLPLQRKTEITRTNPNQPEVSTLPFQRTFGY